jgi:hypothetical protein
MLRTVWSLAGSHRPAPFFQSHFGPRTGDAGLGRAHPVLSSGTYT